MHNFTRRFHTLFWAIFVNGIASWAIIPPKLRLLMYRLFGMNVMADNIRSNCHFETRKIKIGEKSFINRYCYFLSTGGINIGKNCYMAPQVMFLTSTHEIGISEKRADKNIHQPIKVGDGTWIGARAIILPGVTIGEGCIIAAGAVVNKDCKSNGLYAGVPAKRIKDLD